MKEKYHKRYMSASHIEYHHSDRLINVSMGAKHTNPVTVITLLMAHEREAHRVSFSDHPAITAFHSLFFV